MDTSFIDLIKEDNLSKIKIDKNLIPVFKTAMRDFQTYFNYMGYTNTRNYQEFFSKYLTTKYNIQKLSIINKSIFTNDDYLGLYVHDKRKIIIDTNSVISNTEILSTFVHEFIHFLVFQNCCDKNIRGNVLDSSFLDEALTEMLKMKILPYTKTSYLPLIKIVNFWLLINEKELNFNMFLNEGNFYEIDNDLKDLLNMYLIEYSSFDYGYGNNSDKLNDLYKKIQRNVIKSLDINIKSIVDYKNIIKKLSHRPSKDIDFINKLYGKIEHKLCDNLNIRFDIKDKFMFYLKEYRMIVETIFKLKKYYNIEFTMDKSKYKILNSKLYKDEQFIRQIKCIKFKLKDEGELKINLNEIDVSKIVEYKDKYEYYLINKKNRIISIINYLKYINDLDIVSCYGEVEETSKNFIKK